MSAKKATPATTRKSVPTSSKSPANGKPKPPAKRLTPPSERSLSPLDIGAAAGEIWGLLAGGDGQSIATLKKAVDAPGDVVLAAIGWLAREDKLEFSASGRTIKVSLKS